ncbi:MAG: amino acid permease [Alphaproteobacteria bacterium]|nr:amino acid permease [Alphaproteobacteria bacterium]
MGASSTHRTIGLISAISLVAGNLVGSGAFMLPAALASYGSISLLSWIFTSAGALVLALIFAKFSMKFHATGGPHVFAGEAFGSHISFFVAWGYWMLTWIGNAAIVVAMYGYLSDLSDGRLTSSELFFIGLFVLFVITLVNLRGIKEASFIQNLVTLLKLVPMVFVPIAAIFIFDIERLTHFVPEGKTALGAFNGAALLTLWSFVGIESATVPAEDVKDPHITIPKATIYGTLIAAVIYILGNLALLGAVDHHELAQSSAPFAMAADKVFGGLFWGNVVAAAAVICCIGTLNGWMLVVGQIPFGAAKQGLFPKFFAHQSTRRVPTYGIIISAICMGCILTMTFDPDLSEQFAFIAELATTTILLLFIVMLLAFGKLIQKGVFITYIDRILLILGIAYPSWTLYGAGL